MISFFIGCSEIVSKLSRKFFIPKSVWFGTSEECRGLIPAPQDAGVSFESEDDLARDSLYRILIVSISNFIARKWAKKNVRFASLRRGIGFH